MKKLTKKSITIILAAIMVLCMGSVALAADKTTESKTLAVTYLADVSYEWTIPDSPFRAGASSGTVEILSKVLKSGTELQITVSSDNATDYYWCLKNQAEGAAAGDVVRYQLQKKFGDNLIDIKKGDVILDADWNTEFTQNPSVEITTSVDELSKKAGYYMDTLTFTANVVDTSNGN